MKIVFMGTPDFAVPSLEALCAAAYDVTLVVSNPDRPRGRGKHMQCCPVKERALERDLCVQTPLWGSDSGAFLDEMRRLAPDIIIVVAYGKILPKELLDIPAYGCVNVHASLLPKYRGAAPIHRAVIDGCAKTGVSLMYLDEEMDAGDVIATAEVDIGRKTTEDLFCELADVGADLLLRYLPDILRGAAPRMPQDHEQATYAPPVTKEEARIDFFNLPERIDAFVRGMYSWPCAWTMYGQEAMKVLSVQPSDAVYDASPGTIVQTGPEGITVACKGGSVVLERIQMPNKKAMEAGVYLLGNEIEKGVVLR